LRRFFIFLAQLRYHLKATSSNRARIQNFFMARLRCHFLLALLILSCGIPIQGPGQSDDDSDKLKQLFLKSRQQMEIEPSPTPRPKPKPAESTTHTRHHEDRDDSDNSTPSAPRARPADSPPRATAAETPSPFHRSTPELTPQGTPQSFQQPKAQPSPTPAPTPQIKKRRGWFGWRHRDNSQIVIQKSGAQNELVSPRGGGENGHWKYLTPEIRRALDQAPVRRNRWKYIVVHNSGTREGNAQIFDYYHRHVRGWPNGLAYHFVIGNGSDSGNGQIEIGSRWTRQISGGHVHSDYLNYISLGICLVGDFNRDLPTAAQYEALDELIRYLRKRVGKVDTHYSIVLGHKEINPRPTDCPGARFPLVWLHRSFPNQ
jgi:hypothetical protein